MRLIPVVEGTGRNEIDSCCWRNRKKLKSEKLQEATPICRFCDK